MTDEEMLQVKQQLQRMVNAAVDERLETKQSEVRRMVTTYGEAITVTEAAQMLNKNSKTIRQWMREGKLTGCSNSVSVASIARLLCGS